MKAICAEGQPPSSVIDEFQNLNTPVWRWSTKMSMSCEDDNSNKNLTKRTLTMAALNFA